MRLNPVTWTLCVEAAFYVLLPLLGWAAWRLGPRARGRQALLVGALIPLGVAWNALAHDQGWSIIATKALPAYLPYFAFGMLLALWSEARRERGAAPFGARATAALVVGGFSIVAGDAYWHATAAPRAVNPWLAIGADLPAGLGFALVVAAVVVGGGAATRWMSARPLAWVGLVSYGVYMWHVPLLLFGRSVGVFPHPYVLRVGVLLVPVLLVSAASWYFVERPAIAWAGRPRKSDGRAHRTKPSRRAVGEPVRHARAERARQAQAEAHAAP
jgi:peptidoglycan/LPS O-acetylase OafA/YrhL